MASTKQVRDWWYLYRCSYGDRTSMFGRSPVYAQNTSHVRALEQAHYNAGYYPTSGGFIGSRRNCPNGVGGKVCQESGRWCSLHNYGLAWDVEYQYNPNFGRPLARIELQGLFDQGKTKYHPDIVDFILGVKNTHGEQMFEWLGYKLGDTMHWQLNVPPERQEVDWSTVEKEQELGMPYEQFVNLVKALFKGRPDKFKGNPAYFYLNKADVSDSLPNGGIYDDPYHIDWTNFWNAYVEVIS